jgi:hypothetical protein
MTWNPIDSPIDYFLLAGRKSPGLARLIGLDTPRKWDERRGYGLSGSVIVFTGLKLAEFDAEIRLYTTKDWDDWHSWRALVAKPPLRTRPKALDIWHPWAELQGVKSVVVLNEPIPVEGEAGEYTATIKFKQYRAPKLALAKPEGSKAKPTDPVDAYIEKLTAQVQTLARGDDAGPLPPLPKF